MDFVNEPRDTAPAKASVLLIDANLEERVLLESGLRDANYNVFPVASAKEALDLIRAGDISVIVSYDPTDEDIATLGSSFADPNFPVIVQTNRKNIPNFWKKYLPRIGNPFRLKEAPTVVAREDFESQIAATVKLVNGSLDRRFTRPPRRLYLDVDPTPAVNDDGLVQLAKAKLLDDPDNKALADVLTTYYAERAAGGDFQDLTRFSPSRHLVYFLVHAGHSLGITKCYRTGSQAYETETRNYKFFGEVNKTRKEFLDRNLGIEGNYLHLPDVEVPDTQGNYEIIRLTHLKGDLLYDKCYEGKATKEDLVKAAIQLARLQTEGTQGFQKGDHPLMDVVNAEFYWTVTTRRKRRNKKDGKPSLFYRHRLDDIFFNQIKLHAGIEVDSGLKNKILNSYFINQVLSTANPTFSGCYVDGNPRDWCVNSIATKFDLENDRFYNSFLDLASLLEFGISPNGHSIPMSEEEKLDVLDRFMLEKVRAKAVVKEDIPLIKRIDAFVKLVEEGNTKYSQYREFYNIQTGGNFEPEVGIDYRRRYVSTYYHAACHKSAIWVGHKAKFSHEANNILEEMRNDASLKVPDNDPYKIRLETDIDRYKSEQLGQVLRVLQNVDIMLKGDMIPKEYISQAQSFQLNWGNLVQNYFR